jgi:serine/threonine protein kinase
VERFVEARDEISSDMIHERPIYVAPELFEYESYDFPVDVYAYGIFIYETVSGLAPYEQQRSAVMLARNVSLGCRPSIPGHLHGGGWARVMERCWERDPWRRPTFEAIVKMLETREFTGGVDNARFLRYRQKIAIPELFARPFE